MSGFTAHHKRVVPAVFCFSLFVVFGSLVFFLTPSTADAIAEQNAILLTISKAQQVYYIAEPDIAANIIINDIVIPPYTWSWYYSNYVATETGIMGRAEDMDWGWRLLPPPQSIWFPSPGMDLISTGVLTGPAEFVLNPYSPPEMRSGTFMAFWQLDPLETKTFTYTADDAAYLADDPPVSIEKDLYVVLPNRSAVQWAHALWSGSPSIPPRVGDAFYHTVSHKTEIDGHYINLPGTSFNKYVVQEGNWSLIAVHGDLDNAQISSFFFLNKDDWNYSIALNYQGKFADNHGVDREDGSITFPTFLDSGVYILEQQWKVIAPAESCWLWRHHIEFHFPPSPSVETYVFKTKSLHPDEVPEYFGSLFHDRTACSCW